MKHKNHKVTWLIDVFLFTGFLISFILDLTGLSWHQWLGLAVGVIAGYHFLVHWDWVKSVTQRFLGRTSGQARLYYILDINILVGFLSILWTGLVISTWFSLPLKNYLLWKNLHLTISILTLLLIVLKIGMHWRWIVRTTKKPLILPRILFGSNHSEQSLVSSSKTDRRDFLKLMGIVGTGALIAIVSALDDRGELEESEIVSEKGDLAAKITTEQETIVNESLPDQKLAVQSPTQAVITPTPSAGSGSSIGCVIRCNLRCSSPGRCHRFVDADRDNLCDLGECA